MDFKCCTKLYRGFIKGNGKGGGEKFKNVPANQLRTLENAMAFPEFCGVLDDDTIMVDFDDNTVKNDDGERALQIIEELGVKCWCYKTENGYHLLFKNTSEVGYPVDTGGRQIKLACGLNADIKVGHKNSLECLKKEGKLRTVLIENDYEDIDPLPKWLYPVKSEIDLKDLVEGDGREPRLFDYRLDLMMTKGISKEDSKFIIRDVVNKYIFTTPLPARELEHTLRDDAYPEKAFFEGRKFKHADFGDFLITNNHIKRLNGELHIYRDGVYTPSQLAFDNAMIGYIKNITKAQKAEVMSYLEAKCEKNTELSSENYIAFKNGIYNLKTDEIDEFSPDIIITNKIPHNYNPHAYHKLLDDTLNKLATDDKSIRALLEESLGYSFYRTSELSSSFMFVGDKANGKSTFLKIVKQVLTEDNYTGLNLSELSDRFNTATLFGKLANIGDDIPDSYIQGLEAATFKKLVSGNELKAEFKGKDVFMFKPYAKMFFSANEIPRIKDPTKAVKRRLVVIPMRGSFTKDSADYDPFIIKKLTTKEALEYFILLGIAGLKRVLKNNSFTECDSAKQALEDYDKRNDPYIEWIDDYGIENINDKTTDEVYWSYRRYMDLNNLRADGKNTFTARLKRDFGVEVIVRKLDGKSIKRYRLR